MLYPVLETLSEVLRRHHYQWNVLRAGKIVKNKFPVQKIENTSVANSACPKPPI